MSYKIPFTNIHLGKVTNVDKTEPSSTQIVERIVVRQLSRNKQDVKKWRNATLLAERKELNPDRTELIRVYQDVILDGHLSALFSTTLNKCLASEYWINGKDGEKDEDSTAKIQTAWFRQLIEYALDSKWWGHSLVQLGDIVDDKFSEIKLIPREYVIPDIHRVKKEVHVSTSEDNLIDYTLPKFKPWILEFGRRTDLGLLHKASPLVLWKKNVMIAWAQFTEMFGMPLRVGKTDVRDPDKLKNMDEMFAQMGQAAYGIFDTEDEVEFVETTRTDTYKVFNEDIKMLNAELSKLILGQTMTTDDGSSRSQAEVHENVLADFISAVKWFLLDQMQNVVFPILVFHGIIPEGSTFEWDRAEQISLKEKLEFVVLLKNAGFVVDKDFVNDTFQIPVEDAPPGAPFGQLSNKLKATTIMNEVADMYSGFAPGHTHKHE